MILRLPQVMAQTGCPKSTLYLRIHQGLMTQPIAIGPRAVGWPSTEVDAVTAARIAGKDEGAIRELVITLHANRALAPML